MPFNPFTIYIFHPNNANRPGTLLINNVTLLPESVAMTLPRIVLLIRRVSQILEQKFEGHKRAPTTPQFLLLSFFYF